MMVESPTIQVALPEFISLSRAAKLLGISRPSLYALIKQGHLTPTRIGNSPFLLRATVEGLKGKQIKGGRPCTAQDTATP